MLSDWKQSDQAGSRVFASVILVLSTFEYTVKPVLSCHSQKDQKWVFKTNYCLMLVKSIAECSPLEHSAILLTCIKQYHMTLRPLFWLFLSDRLREVSLYAEDVIS